MMRFPLAMMAALPAQLERAGVGSGPFLSNGAGHFLTIPAAGIVPRAAADHRGELHRSAQGLLHLDQGNAQGDAGLVGEGASVAGEGDADVAPASGLALPPDPLAVEA